MKLRLKVLIALATLWAIISLGLYAYSRSTLLEDYKTLETQELIHDVNQTKNILVNMMSSLKLITADWAQWDDAYQFMQNKNETFIKSNMSVPTFANAKINLILFFDTKGELFYGSNYDLVNEKFIPIPKDILDRLIAEKIFTQLQGPQENKAGILTTPEGYVVLSAYPILTSEGKGPAKGTIVMGYFFNDTQIQKLSEIAGIQVKLFPLPLHHPNPSLSDAL